jgi:hypothetical protein
MRRINKLFSKPNHWASNRSTEIAKIHSLNYLRLLENFKSGAP